MSVIGPDGVGAWVYQAPPHEQDPLWPSAIDPHRPEATEVAATADPVVIGEQPTTVAGRGCFVAVALFVGGIGLFFVYCVIRDALVEPSGSAVMGLIVGVPFALVLIAIGALYLRLAFSRNQRSNHGAVGGERYVAIGSAGITVRADHLVHIPWENISQIGVSIYEIRRLVTFATGRHGLDRIETRLRLAPVTPGGLDGYSSPGLLAPAVGAKIDAAPFSHVFMVNVTHASRYTPPSDDPAPTLVADIALRRFAGPRYVPPATYSPT